MQDETIVQILKQADEAIAPPNVGGDTASRVRQRVRKRRIVKGAGIAATISAVAITALMLLPRSERVSPTVLEVAAVESLRQIELDATISEKTVVALESIRSGRMARETEPLDPLALLTKEKNRAALTLIQYGDMMRRDLNDSRQAIAAYQQATRLFPESDAARIAKRRLIESGI